MMRGGELRSTMDEIFQHPSKRRSDAGAGKSVIAAPRDPRYNREAFAFADLSYAASYLIIPLGKSTLGKEVHFGSYNSRGRGFI